MSQYDCAPDQASATIRRLLEARSARSRTGLADVRQALDAATRAFEAATMQSASPDDDAEIAAFVDRLAATAADELDRASTQADITAADNARLSAELNEAQEQLEARRQQQKAIEQDLAASMARVAELELSAAESATLTADLDEARRQLAASEQQRTALAGELTHATAHIKALELAVADHATLTIAIEDVREQLQNSERHLAASQQLVAEGQQQLAESREQFAAQLSAVENQVTERELALLERTEQLTASEQQREQLTRELAASAQRITQLEAVSAGQVTLAAALDDLRRQLEASEEQRTMLASDLAAAATEIQRLESAGSDRATLSASVDDLRQQLTASEEQRTILASDLAAASAEIEQLELRVTEHASMATALEHAQQQLETSEGDRESMAGELATCSARIQTLESSIEHSRVFVDQLPAIFRSVSGARSIPDALTAVANGLTCYFSRVAIFRVRTNRLEAVYQDGFDFAGDLSSVVVPLTGESPLTEALSTERVKVLLDADLKNTPIPFGGAPGSALIVPIAIEQKTVAVVYADDASRPAEGVDADERAAFAQLIREYVMAHIDRIVSSQRMLAELDAYARMLLDEVEQLYQTDLTAGRPAAQLQARLRENLQTARQIYAQRVELEPPAAAALLEDRIAKVTLDTPPTPFGRDLLEVTTSDTADTRKKRTPAAQAS